MEDAIVTSISKRSRWFGLVSLGALIAACGSGTTSPSSSGAAKCRVIDMVMAQLPSTFDGPIVAGVKAEAQKLGVCVTVNAQGPNQQSATGQVPYLAAAITAHPDALIIHPADPQALLGSLAPYFSAHIPVLTTLSTLNNSQVTASWVGNYTAEGVATADAMGPLMNGKGVVQLMEYDLTDPAGQARVNGFKQEMAAKFPNVTFLSPDVTGPNATISAAHSKADLIAHPDITGFFGNGSIVGIGIIAGVGDEAAQGKIVIGTDGGNSALLASMNQGRVQVLSCDDTYQEGVQAMDTLVKIWAGTSYTKATNLDEDVTFTKSEDANANVTACIARAVA